MKIFPNRQRVRVRGIQVHGAASDLATAGQRTALNLAGVQVEDLARGMTLTAPGLLEPTQRIEVQLSLLSDAKPLKNRARVHLHAFASETIAEIGCYGRARRSNRAHPRWRNCALKILCFFYRVTGRYCDSTRRW